MTIKLLHKGIVRYSKRFRYSRFLKKKKLYNLLIFANMVYNIILRYFKIDLFNFLTYFFV